MRNCGESTLPKATSATTDAAVAVEGALDRPRTAREEKPDEEHRCERYRSLGGRDHAAEGPGNVGRATERDVHRRVVEAEVVEPEQCRPSEALDMERPSYERGNRLLGAGATHDHERQEHQHDDCSEDGEFACHRRALASVADKQDGGERDRREQLLRASPPRASPRPSNDGWR